jgi:hypothetical protein
VDIKEGADQQVTPYMLEGVIVGKNQEFIGLQKVQSKGGTSQGLKVVDKVTKDSANRTKEGP